MQLAIDQMLAKAFNFFAKLRKKGRIKKRIHTDEVARLIKFAEEKALENKNSDNKTKIKFSVIPTIVMIWNTPSVNG